MYPGNKHMTNPIPLKVKVSHHLIRLWRGRRWNIVSRVLGVAVFVVVAVIVGGPDMMKMNVALKFFSVGITAERERARL